MTNQKLILFGRAGFVVLVTLVVMIVLISIYPQKKSNCDSDMVKCDKHPETEKQASVEESEDHIKDLDVILNGIRKLELNPAHVIPGFLTVYGKNAFPIAFNKFRSSNRPIASAGRYGKGRFAAFSHSTFFIDDGPPQFDNDQFLRNVVNWTVSSKPKAHIGMCVYPQDLERFKRVLSEQEFVTYSDIKECSNQKLENVTYLKEHDLLFLNDHKVNNQENVALREFVASGGGLILGAAPWSNNNAKSGLQLFANKILNSIGVAFATNRYYFVRSTEINLTKSNLEDTNAYQVWLNFKTILHSNQSVNMRDRLLQMENILADRIDFAPMDKNFSREMVNEFQLLVNANRLDDSIKTSLDHNLWKKFTQSIKSAPNEMATNAFVAVENIVHSNFTVYSGILKEIVAQFKIIMHT